MNRFLVFAGDNYYPNGGWRDYRGSFATLEEAKAEAKKAPGDWAQVVDLENPDAEPLENF